MKLWLLALYDLPTPLDTAVETKSLRFPAGGNCMQAANTSLKTQKSLKLCYPLNISDLFLSRLACFAQRTYMTK
jgi:hypothetical protein